MMKKFKKDLCIKVCRTPLLMDVEVKKIHSKIKTKKTCVDCSKSSKNRDKNYIFVLHGS